MLLPGPGRGARTILAMLAMLAVAVAAPAGRAETDDFFVVRGVDVDVTADSAAAAREAALAEGQRKALDQLLLRLALADDVARLPRLSDSEIAEMVQDFQVVSERTSSVRYIGELAYRFKAEPVRQLLDRHGIRFVGIASNPVLVLPVLTTAAGSELWGEPNPWRDAWAARPPTDELVPLVVPLGDLADLTTIDAEAALAGDAEGFAALAERYGTGDTIVAEARLAEPGGDELRLDLSAKRYAEGQVRETYVDSLVDENGDQAALLRHGIERLDAMVQEAWKQANLVSFGAEQTLIATVPLETLSDWVEVRRRLDGIALVRRSEILYLTRREGRLRLAFVGAVGQLERALAQQDLSLAPGPEGSWVLRRAAPPVEATAPPAEAVTPSAPAAVN